MPNIDKLQGSDMYLYPDYSKKDCKCNQGGMYWGPPIPPVPPPDYPFPPFPPHPCPPPEEPDVKKNSIEGQICKLSKKAAAINRMIDNLENKKKDVIIKIGDTSFNFDNIDAEFDGWEDGSYAETVAKILKHQRELIQAQIKELADTLDDTDDSTNGTEKAISGNSEG